MYPKAGSGFLFCQLPAQEAEAQAQQRHGKSNGECPPVRPAGIVNGGEHRGTHDTRGGEADPHDTIVDSVVLRAKLIGTETGEHAHKGTKANAPIISVTTSTFFISSFFE